MRWAMRASHRPTINRQLILIRWNKLKRQRKLTEYFISSAGNSIKSTIVGINTSYRSHLTRKWPYPQANHIFFRNHSWAFVVFTMIKLLLICISLIALGQVKPLDVVTYRKLIFPNYTGFRGTIGNDRSCRCSWWC